MKNTLSKLYTRYVQEKNILTQRLEEEIKDSKAALLILNKEDLVNIILKPQQNIINNELKTNSNSLYSLNYSTNKASLALLRHINATKQLLKQRVEHELTQIHSSLNYKFFKQFPISQANPFQKNSLRDVIKQARAEFVTAN